MEVERLVAWYRAHRRELPWHGPAYAADPYAIWISEVMAQQTRLTTVMPYWRRWMAALPTVHALAAAPLDRVLGLWSGLGYYSRARNLQAAAKKLVDQGGTAACVPRTARDLAELPGIGAYVSAAVASIAGGERIVVVDGNVERVMARYLGIVENVRTAGGRRAVRAGAQALLDATDNAPGDINQAIMELGATVCAPSSPACDACPLATTCWALAHGQAESLPVVPARKAISSLPLLQRRALWLVRDGAVLLARRKPGGLFGGLWELPAAQTWVQAAHEVGAAIGRPVRAVYRHDQVLSHRRLVVEVGAALWQRQLGVPNDSSYDDVQWVLPTRATSMGLAVATRAILTAAANAKDMAWTISPKRSVSSPKATAKSLKVSANSATTSKTKTSVTRRRARPKASTTSSPVNAKRKRRSMHS